MRSPGINGERELRGQPANAGSPGKMAVKTECVCICVHFWCVSAQLFQVDLEPNGKLHVIIELSGSASEGILLENIVCISYSYIYSFHILYK